MATITVLNNDNSGAGSLRQAIADATAGDTIVFDDSLAGETITLDATLGPRNEITIVGLTDSDGNPAITVDGNGKYVFSTDNPIHISNIAFNGGKGAFSSIGGYDGLTFENCTFENMDLRVFELFTESPTSESVEFTDCVFRNNDTYDIWIDGMVNVILSGGNVLTEGINFTAAEPLVITNANYNGVGGYSAQSGGTASVAGSGHIALPDAATITIAQTVTRSEFGAGLTAISANELTNSWTATDTTKSVLLEVENGADWDTVDDDATSPATVSAAGTYRVWDGVAFFSTNVGPEPEPEPEPEPVAVRPGRLVRAQLQMTYENEGESAIPAGTPIQIGSAFGVAEVAIPAGATGVISILGTWILPCADTTVASMGDVACWDDTNKVITTAPSGSSAGLTVEYMSLAESGATFIFYVADVSGWEVGDRLHIEGYDFICEVRRIRTNTGETYDSLETFIIISAGYKPYTAPEEGTLVKIVEAPDVLPVGVFVESVTSSDTSCRVTIFPTGKTSAVEL